MRHHHRDLSAGVPESPDDPGSVWILWDPSIVGEDDYAALVAACGDLVRASGGLGVERRNGSPPMAAERGNGDRK